MRFRRNWRSEWRRNGGESPPAAVQVEEAHRLLNLGVGRNEDVSAHRQEICALLQQLADAVERFCEQGVWESVLGM